MESIYATSPHYIRCIKPNYSKKPNEFSQLLVLQQLRCGGVLECIRISKTGYPTRRLYYAFLKRYKVLVPKLISKSNTLKPKDYSEAIVKALGVNSDGYQVGLTKIFLRAGLLAKFEKMRGDLMIASTVKIQKTYRGYFTRKYYASLKKKAVYMQSVIRMLNAQHQATNMRQRRASTKMQKTWRMWAVKKDYLVAQKSTLLLQSGKEIVRVSLNTYF
jgi:myosin-5